MRLFLALSLSLMLASGVNAADRPIVIAHRGASGLLPEHTIAAYTRAIDDGADFIEPDLVPTRDGVLVARHENEISGTTDVASRAEFEDRKTTKTIDGASVTGWFTEDFTLAELKTLRARERLPELRGTANDGRFVIPTLDEIITLAKARGVGIYPETKHPSYFASIGLPLEATLIAALDAAGWRDAAAPVFIQSFEVNNLKQLNTMTGVRLIQLVAAEGGPADGARGSYAEMLTPEGLKAVAAYADGIGPEKTLVIPRGADMRLAAPTRLVADAHAAGLKVHPWTFRAENYFLPADHRKGEDPRAHGDLVGEIRAYLAAGIDGLFSDFTAEAVTAH
ncbi:glycerophosphoryl diester phosphodiesterase [Sphingosinicella microcystinivorans]|uniref:glycerophosphodiester phosphodiesterase n=2 Tax=Sphingosinicella microcystinivorans TaxID=335406 RepID=A0AAD1G0B7_SPHMI|nr:glycerophosphoryl diester phosphodiesterase [Sphingosinicella microcystinivorans]BBE33687.1 glycerophosphoryl diester phosphodiesterase [Sphingosinicella microcystinivorans]